MDLYFFNYTFIRIGEDDYNLEITIVKKNNRCPKVADSYYCSQTKRYVTLVYVNWKIIYF